MNSQKLNGESIPNIESTYEWGCVIMHDSNRPYIPANDNS